MKEKINNYISKIRKVLTLVDTKVRPFVANDKIRKILYITILSFVTISLLLILLAVILSPFRKTKNNEFAVSKSKTDSQIKREIILTETEKELLKLENDIKNLKFPPKELITPDILFKIVL